MATQTKVKIAGCSKANSKRSFRNKKSGKYAIQFMRTAANKIRKRAKYLRTHPNN